MNRIHSTELFEKSKNYIPGGVNSPVRAFKAVGGDPLFIKKAEGAYLIDEDNNRFIDLINSWGPMILGHASEITVKAVSEAAGNSISFGAPGALETEMAELITSMVPSIEKVRMVNSGTEATMSAVRLARGYTGKEKIIKFQGCYHGHGDSFLIAAGSGAVTMGVPDSPGVTRGTAMDTLIAPYNDLNAVEKLIQENRGEIACIIVEPVAGNMGCVLPEPDFLEGLRNKCKEHGIVLIFDEVMTGFRLSKAGAQGIYKIDPDITTLGKIIGGGMPVGAYGGKKEIMDRISPLGPVYQAGTLSGNPLAMAAGLSVLRYLNEHEEVYEDLNKTTTEIVSGFKENLDKLGLDYKINHIGSMFSLFFTNDPVKNFSSAKKSDLNLFSGYFKGMLDRGIYLAPSQFESLFVSTSITGQEINKIVSANLETLQQLAT